MDALAAELAAWGWSEWLNLALVALGLGLFGWAVVGIAWAHRPGRARRDDPTLGDTFAKLKRRFHAEDLAELEARGVSFWRPDPRKVREAARRD